MPNLSLKGEDIFLQTGKAYFIIDALYLNDIGENLPLINIESFERDLKEKVFPHTETPFAVISLDDSSNGLKKIEISKIKKVDDEGIDNRCFSTDTGLIILIEKSNLLEFIKRYNYGKLVEGLHALINASYWIELERGFDSYSCGLILSPGIKSGFDFDGSGLYRLEV